MDVEVGISYAKAAALLGAAFTMGIGSIGPSIAGGLVGSSAVENTGKYPEATSKIRMTMMIAMGLIDTSSIFCLIISGALLVLSRTL
ncbi:MAG TPA: ATP synthase F0 subunit C [Candidatus Babeliales bacterium]|nr:ATP synthase F0 subunit C [Candidatus Babeliales bacterium]